MTATMRHHSPPRYAVFHPDHGDTSAALQAFRRMTDGLSGRLRFPSIASMRAGAVRCPHTVVLQFLQAGHRAGLSQAWAEQFAVWLRVQVDALWAREPLPLKEARRRALSAEGRENAAEQTVLQDGETLATLREERDAVAEEIRADMVRVSALSARIRLLEAGA